MKLEVSLSIYRPIDVFRAVFFVNGYTPMRFTGAKIDNLEDCDVLFVLI